MQHLRSHAADTADIYPVDIYPAVIALARQAGAAILDIYRQPSVAVQYKADDSPVTQADLAAHRLIVAGLAAITPQIPVVSEEDSASHGVRLGGGLYWLIDPLDGTKEFVARRDEFTVNIALMADGFPRWGVVHAPALNQTFWGGANDGAWQDVNAQVEGLSTSRGLDGAEQTLCWRVVASKSHMNADTLAFIEQLGSCVLVRAGSSLKFCRIAQGQADIYPRLSPTCEWDTAAAQAVVEGAGGQVLDLDGQRLRYGKPEVLNPSFVAFAPPAKTRVCTMLRPSA